ncbi:hypothetical protein B0H16DRAFT_1491293 [Mycena metata]|uniref:Uncharacterized protein n=1 Tax=Mycena metata TaxID=1033252 RepID=A0AAD7P125_9AGAR|nr:hypothetical protein B0H16DRAFT_1491293 [Mycena metata]
MPPRTVPKVFQVLVKTHKLTVLTTVAPTISVAELKDEILSALSSDVNQVDGVPRVSAPRDFELCKAVQERGKPTGDYQLLGELSLSLRDAGVANWEPLFVRFRAPGSDELSPVVFVPFEDDEEEVAPHSAPAAPAEASSSRGKRKARPD